MTGHMHTFSGFAPADSFGQIGKHLSLAWREASEGVLRRCLPLFALVEKKPEDRADCVGREPCLVADHAADDV